MKQVKIGQIGYCMETLQLLEKKEIALTLNTQ